MRLVGMGQSASVMYQNQRAWTYDVKGIGFRDHMANLHAAIISRIKILSEMNIAEHRLPQDGRFRVKAYRRDIDFRVSTIPTSYGEKVVLRLFDKAQLMGLTIDKLGLERNARVYLLPVSLSFYFGLPFSHFH